MGAGALGQPLDEVLLVPAPRDVHGPDFARAEPESAGSGGHQQRAVVAGAAAQGAPQHRAVGHVAALRAALAHPPAGEVEDLVGAGRQREQYAQSGEVVGLAGAFGGGGVRAGRCEVGRGGGGGPQHPAVVEAVAHLHREAGAGIVQVQDEGVGGRVGSGAVAAPARWPPSPGVPAQASASVGSTVNPRGVSGALPGTAGTEVVRRCSASPGVTGPGSAPQRSTSGSPPPALGARSTTSPVPDRRRTATGWTGGLEAVTMRLHTASGERRARTRP
ncbi:hypothetical protein HNR25_001323 [Streptomonospora salina]|uniref:Uncharacterized protein n=1 Tax=Streptomonospora salina TaxID=104205 RepID=A0A841E495_9ACTN|nr:hypothetical protein [Streptomonospora salina]